MFEWSKRPMSIIIYVTHVQRKDEVRVNKRVRPLDIRIFYLMTCEHLYSYKSYQLAWKQG
jgi:hypothetical protein